MAVKLIRHFACERDFSALRCHTYRTGFGPISLTSSLLREIEWLENCPKYEIEKQNKSPSQLCESQAKCPITYRL